MQVPSIKREQLLKINNACSNDWELNTFYYLSYGEKTLIKRVDLDEESYLQFELYYNSRNQISIRISKYNIDKATGYGVSHGLGKHKILVEDQAKRKNINSLIELTHELDNNKLMEINQSASISSGYGIVGVSKNF